ncbi:hypothetical protein KJ611_03445 [Patescibacteria group bacterium]|nr:hypothetical protein [Patescibacteria group bacterium]MBU1705776.1 hypothetical protein [Patescibacteria group bacterium]
MKNILFPADYKQALLDRFKNMTIRVGEEMGKYRVGETYRAESYDGEDWDVNVLIKDVQMVDLDQLVNLGVSDVEIEKVKSEGGQDQVEVIRFEIMG